MIGQVSSVRCAPVKADQDLDLFMHLTPFGDVQSLCIHFNGTEIDRFRLKRPGWYASPVPSSLLSSSKDNIVTFEHPDAKRPVDVSNSKDDRLLAIAVRSIALVPASIDQASAAPIDARGDGPVGGAPLKELAMRFESLGHNCEFGLVQRRCGAEPLGLLRFSSIKPPELIEGLEIGFADIADDNALSFFFAKDDECHGRHARYGLNYHTFRYRKDIDLQAFRGTERTRLQYLAERLTEQLREAGKIFVLQRPGLALREVRPVVKMLQHYNPANRLLWVAESQNEAQIGTIELLSRSLARGYIDRLAPEDNAPDLSFDAWIKICQSAATVFPE